MKGSFDELARRLAGLGKAIGDDMVKELGEVSSVTCTQCGRTESVDSREALRSGWPKCCGLPMRLNRRHT